MQLNLSHSPIKSTYLGLHKKAQPFGCTINIFQVQSAFFGWKNSILFKVGDNYQLMMQKAMEIIMIDDDHDDWLMMLMMMMMKQVSLSRHKRRNVVGKREHQPALLM